MVILILLVLVTFIILAVITKYLITITNELSAVKQNYNKVALLLKDLSLILNIKSLNGPFQIKRPTEDNNNSAPNKIKREVDGN